MLRQLSELALQLAIWLGALVAAAVALVAVGFTLKVMWWSLQFGWGLL